MTITLFSWGYWGWGASTRELVQAVDAAEAAKGFRPPIFVDVRLVRHGRAKGFVGNAFRDLVGESRSRWIENLGNADIATGGRGIRIKKPEAVAELFDLSLREAKEQRRVIFYCACEYPWIDGKRWCHRDKITELLLAHANKMGQSISVVEWPGEEPVEVQLEVDRKVFSAVMRGRMSIPFSDTRFSRFAGLPWGSALSLACTGVDGTRLVAVGPARFATSKNGNGFWYLPLMEPAEPGTTMATLVRRAEKWRIAHGLQARQSP